jgi:hypothetical protein
MAPVWLAEVFGPGLPIGLVFALLSVVLPIVAIGDALSRPASAFYDAGTHRLAWVMVLIVAIFLGLGFFFAAYYLIGVRGKVTAHMPVSRA